MIEAGMTRALKHGLGIRIWKFIKMQKTWRRTPDILVRSDQAAATDVGIDNTGEMIEISPITQALCARMVFEILR